MGDPRVRLEYPADQPGQTRELPFVVGVIADGSAHGGRALPPLEQRAFLPVDRNHLDAVLAASNPALKLRVADEFGRPDDLVDIDLAFRSLDDFGPEAVVRRLPHVFGARGARSAARQLAVIMHHPDFKRLEATWRGLAYLVAHVPDGAPVQVRFLNMDRRTLASDLKQRDGVEASVLFRRLYDDFFEDPATPPFSLLVSDFAFGHHADDDIAVLRGMAGVAEYALAPWLACASPALFDLEQFADLASVRTAKLFERADYAPWKSFRESEAAKFVGLTAPNLLGRAPHDLDLNDFHFEETRTEERPWIGSSWALAGRLIAAFARDGWVARGVGRPNGELQDLPAGAWGQELAHVDGEIADAQAGDLAQGGIVALSGRRPAILAAPSCHKPKSFFDARAGALAAQGAKMNVLLCVTRFVHYVKFLAGKKAGESRDPKRLETYLNEQLQSLVGSGSPDAAHPLREAKVEVQRASGAPYLQAKVTLRTDHQMDGQDFSLRLGVELPVRA